MGRILLFLGVKSEFLYAWGSRIRRILGCMGSVECGGYLGMRGEGKPLLFPLFVSS